MSFIDALRHRIRTVLRPDAEQRDRAEEFEFHQALSARDSSRDAARREFGNPTYLNESVRWAGATRWIDTLRQDLRYGLRTLARSPVFTLVAVLSVGLGVGANTAVFGILYKVMLERLPVPRAEELVMLERAGVQFGFTFSREQYEAVARAPGVRVTGFTSTFAENAEIDGSRIAVDGIDLVDSLYYPTLELKPDAGRFLNGIDVATAAPVAVTSHRFATRHFGSAAAAVGKTLRLNATPFTIVGVTPRSYQGLMLLRPPEVIVPYTAKALIQPRPGTGPHFIVARVPGTDSPQAAAITGAFQQCCADAQPGKRVVGAELADNSGAPSATLSDISRGITVGKFDVRVVYGRTLYALMGGVALLLLIACTNVGNLLLARAVVRSRELAVRLSLGASRVRIMRQLLVESSLIALFGAVVGVVFAVWGTGFLARNLPANLSMLNQLVTITPRMPVLAFTAGVAVFCVLLFGVFPALRATRFDLTAQLREQRPSGTGLGRIDRAIVAVQVGLALVLASGAGLLVATLRNLSSGTRTLEPDRLLIVEVDLRGGPHENRPFKPLQQEMAREFGRIPGVQSVSGTTLIPLLFMAGSERVLYMPGYESAPNSEVRSGIAPVEAGFFTTMSIAVRGREFDARDVKGAEPVVIISQSIADKFFRGRDPLGELLRLRGSEGPEGGSFRIVGVAEDVKYFDLRAAAPRQLFFPFEQTSTLESFFGMRPLFAIRTSGPAADIVPATRKIIDALLPGVRVRRNQPMTDAASLVLGREQALATVALVFGGLAVSLAAIGLYGVLAFHVTTRRREIGVRIALGANHNQVVGMVIRQSLLVVIVGTILGVPLSLAAARSMGALLYGIAPWDPGPLALAALVLIATGVLASLLPSRNAARVDPLIAMRAE
jgi:putative ABC transport system permease protein